MVDELPVPEPGANDLLVRVAAIGTLDDFHWNGLPPSHRHVP